MVMRMGRVSSRRISVRHSYSSDVHTDGALLDMVSSCHRSFFANTIHARHSRAAVSISRS